VTKRVASNQAVSLDADIPHALGNRAEPAGPTTSVQGPVAPVQTLHRRKEASPSPTVGGFQETKSTPWYRTGIGALGIVLASIVAAVWAFKRWVPAVRAADGGLLRVVGRTSLTPKHSLALVRMGRRFVLVGVSGDRLSRLCEVSDPEEVAELAARAGIGTTPSTNAFDNLLLHEAASYEEPDEPELAGGDRSDGPDGGRVSRSLTGLLTRLRSVRVG
jgi:flagellar biosynthetic protein FliO